MYVTSQNKTAARRTRRKKLMHSILKVNNNY